jgi:ABC-type branched-subunit amino acid transport system ATPase component/branched-subunit amino acid ABC-type transport system permease component
MTTFLTLLISGLVSGALYSVYATGITLTFSTSGIYNFAFGAVAFLVDLLFYQLVVAIPLNPWLAAAICVLVFAPLLGLAMERSVFAAMARGPEVSRIVGSIGLVIALPAIGLFFVQILGSHAASVQSLALVPGIGPEPPRVFSPFAGLTIDSDQLMMLGVAALAALSMWYLVTRTRLGLNMRALVDRREMAQLRGIAPAPASRAAWILGSTLAGLVGVIGGPLFGISTVNAIQFVVVSSAVVVLARFRSLPVSFAGGLLLGALVSFVAGYSQDNGALSHLLLSVPGLAIAPPYLVLFAGLMWLGRSRARVAGIASDEHVPFDYRADLSRWRKYWPWAVAAVITLGWSFGVIPVHSLSAGPVQVSLVTDGVCTALVFLSFTVLTGIGGMVSLGQAAFVTAGALVAGYVAGHHVLGGNFLVALVLGAAVAGLIGVIFAWPAIRLGRLALALATLALGLIGDNIFFQFGFIDNGGLSWQLTRPHLGPLNFSSNKAYLALVAVILVIAIALVVNLGKSASGRAVYALRDSAAAAASVGISLVRSRLAIFTLAAAMAGVGGVLLSYANGTANNGQYPTTQGLLWLTIAVTWGVRRPVGAVLSGLVGALLPWVIANGIFGIPGTSNLEIPSILFGLGAVQLARTPDGILTEFSKRNFERRERRRRTRTETAGDRTAAARAAAQRVPAAATAPGPLTGQGAVSGAGSQASGLTIDGLSAGYDGLSVLHDVSLTVPPGSIVALVGANGAGKSTLCSTVAGLVPATGGRVRVGGDDITNRPTHERAQRGVVLAPESRGIFPGMSVEDNLTVWLPDQADRQQVFERFPILRERRKLDARSLSGGEQQMLCIGPLLIRPPRVLVADEPILGLAPQVAATVLGLLGELRDKGVALLLVEERARSVLEIADHVAFLANGVIGWSGSPAELSEHEAVSQYLGTSLPTGPEDQLSRNAASLTADAAQGRHQIGAEG